MKNSFLISAMIVLMLSCASDSQKGIEEARFLLDQGDFAGAIALVEPILEAEPSNGEAKFILASALIGDFALEPKSGCLDTDTGYLGVLACLLDDKEAGDSNGLKTFERIAPEDGNSNDNIVQAVDILASITTFSQRVPEKDVALQRLVARSFAVSTIFQIIGANSANTECNDGSLPNGVDDVPDDYDASNLTGTQAADFRANLEGIEIDAEIVGFAGDFNLVTRVTDILDDVEAIGGSTLTSVRTLFNSSYNTPAQQVCN